MKGLKLKSENLFKLLLFPFLFPLSVLYGLCAFINKKISGLNQVSLGVPVISVGNFTVGGTGKTPVVLELLRILQGMGKDPVVVSKSYKASLKQPKEVLSTSSVSEVGDEAFLIKSKLPEVKVFSGPHKTKTALFAAAKLVDRTQAVFIIDDGAQHQGVFKDFKIHVWDMSLPKMDILPMPFGRAREFWFLGEKPSLTLLNRSKHSGEAQVQENPKFLRMSYDVQRIKSTLNSEPLRDDGVLISGIGNFNQLEVAVKAFLKPLGLKLLKSIRGRDHDNFDWFKPEGSLKYICTEKDYSKLIGKVDVDHLYLVESSFSQNFNDGLKSAIEHFLQGNSE